MLTEDIKTLEFNQYKKSNKTPFFYYVDLECIINQYSMLFSLISEIIHLR